MLIKFQSKATASFSMLADHALPLLAAMGQADRLEGSISEDNLAAALTRLEAALLAAAEAPEQEPVEPEEEDADEEQPVNISVRALPLLEMLRRAKAKNTYVMWQPE